MCGIVGILSTDKEKQNSLTKALASINHRGPDGSACYYSSECALGHARLSVIDLSPAANQPMIDAQSGLVIVYSGEIYNYLELRRTLDDQNFASNSDTEVILKYFVRYGEKCVNYFRGMFAFAIWDTNKNRLFVARDRLGIKPLFFFFDRDCFIFASEIKAILEFQIRAEPDLQTCYEYITTGITCNNENTFFQNISSLKPGYCGYVRSGCVDFERYWQLDICNVREGVPQSKIEEDLWGIYEEVGRLHMVSDIQVGITLSAGLDSVFLLHLMSKLGFDNLNSFTFGYDETTYDQIRMQQQLEINIPHTSYQCRLKPNKIIEMIERQTWHYEVPLGGLGDLSVFQLMELAANNDTRVLLSGEGADEVFAGYKYYYSYFFRDCLEKNNYKLLDRILRIFNESHKTNYSINDKGFLELLAKNNERINVLAPDGTSLSNMNFVGKAFDNLINEKNNSTATKLKGRMKDDLTELKIPKLLTFQDRASMAWGVETRVPYLDHKLIEYVFSLPPESFFQYGGTKDLIRQALKRNCNYEYPKSTKLYVATPQREWLKEQLAVDVLNYVDTGIIAQTDLIDYPKWRRTYQEYAASPELGNSFFVWKTLCLEALFRNYFPDYKM